MNRFEKKDSGPATERPVSPEQSLAPPTKPPAPDRSPVSGRRLEKKDSVDHLMKKFGGRVRTPSPDIPPKPSLPPKSPSMWGKGVEGWRGGWSRDVYTGARAYRERERACNSLNGKIMRCYYL